MLVARAFGAVRLVVTDIDEKGLSTAKELGADSTILVSLDMNVRICLDVWSLL